MSTRKMATIRRIDAINPIPNSDNIEVATVGGWKVVVKKGEYQVNDLAVYCEIDSFIPTTIASFLTKPGHTPKVYEGVEGERLRTVKLRKTLSQGLLLPLTVITDNGPDVGFGFSTEVRIEEGFDVSEALGIVKYEPPVPAQLAGLVKGPFPSQIPKTDAERIQNLSRELNEWIEQKIKFEVTIKLDGSSMTVAKIGDDVHVCSRNLSLKLDQDGNTFVEAAKKYDLINKLKDYPIDLAIQGELIGPGIQNNQEKLSSHEFYVFEIYDIKGGRYLSPTDRYKVCDELGLKHTPVPHASIELSELGLKTVDDALAFAEGKSLNPAVSREGVVFKNEDGSIKWKSISNSWLMKNGE